MSNRATLAPQRVRFPLFDSLRAIAALSVFAFHVSFLYGLTFGHELPVVGDSLARWLAQLGTVGVSIFFAISGFLLYRPFAQARFDGAPAPTLGAYGIRRILRIFPAYWLALVGVAVWLGLSEVWTPRGVAIHFGLLQGYSADHVVAGIGQGWTLTIELAFYLVLPLWALALRQISAATERSFLLSELGVLFAAVVVSVAWNAVAVHTAPPGSDTLHVSLIALPAFFDHFAAGMALAVVSVSSWRPRVIRALEGAPWAGWVVAAAALWAMTRIIPTVDGWGFEYIVHHELEVLLAVGVVAPAVFGAAGVVQRVLSNRVLLWLGTVSYGFYLWHVAIATELEDQVGTSLGLIPYVAIAFAATAAVSAASWYGLERHAIALGVRLTRRPTMLGTADPVPALPPNALAEKTKRD